jgi:hypothetical protein
MSALLTPGPSARRAREGDPRTWPNDPASGPTLDDVVTRAWEVLRAELPAACPVCGGELTPRPSAGSGIAGGRCDACGSTLS